MSTGISLQRVEKGPSNDLGTAAYRVEFLLSDSVGQYGPLPVAQAREPRSRVSGTIAVNIPVDQTAEQDVFRRAREVLHEALTRLVEAAATQPPR